VRTMLDGFVGGGRLVDDDEVLAAGVVDGRDGTACSSTSSSELASAGSS